MQSNIKNLGLKGLFFLTQRKIFSFETILLKNLKN